MSDWAILASLPEQGPCAESVGMAARFFHRFRPRVVLVALAVILVNPLSLNAARNLAGFDIFASTGASMEPTYSGHEFGIGLPAWSGRPGRGDIVSFASPRGDGETFMKRVVGLPGETIGVTSSGILVDGELLDEPYIRAGTERHPATWSLGPDEYFVMGDNRGYSLDSR